MLEFAIELERQTAIVPWGADLKMVEEALRQLIASISTTQSANAI
jgi:hypothetical protein